MEPRDRDFENQANGNYEGINSSGTEDFESQINEVPKNIDNLENIDNFNNLDNVENSDRINKIGATGIQNKDTANGFKTSHEPTENNEEDIEYTDEDEGMDVRWDGVPFARIWKNELVEDKWGRPNHRFINQATKTEFDPEGFDKDGFNRDGYNRIGFDRDGYDRSGHDMKGFDRDGINEKTGTKFNPNGYDVEGYDQDGFNREGRDRDGYDRDGYLCGRDRRLYDREGWDPQGYNKFTLTQYDLDGFDQEGFDKDGYDRDGYNHRGFDKNGFDREGYDSGGWKNGINKITNTKYDKKGFNKDGYDKDGFNKYGINHEGFNRRGRMDEDVKFANNFVESDAKSIRDYAESVGISYKEAEQTIHIARAKCEKIDNLVREFIEDNQRARMAVILRDTAEYLNGGIDFYGFWNKHPRLSVDALVRRFIKSPTEKLEYMSRFLKDIKLDDEHLFANVRMFVGPQKIIVTDAINNIQELKQLYHWTVDKVNPKQIAERHKESHKLSELQKYLRPHEDQYAEDLIDVNIRIGVDGAPQRITESDIKAAKESIVREHGLISKLNVKRWLDTEFAKRAEAQNEHVG